LAYDVLHISTALGNADSTWKLESVLQFICWTALRFADAITMLPISASKV